MLATVSHRRGDLMGTIADEEEHTSIILVVRSWERHQDWVRPIPPYCILVGALM
jgi:hypothetical protein